MLFVLQVMKIFPAFFFNGSVVDIMTPYGIKPLVLEAGEATQIHVPDFHTILTFAYKHRRVSYPIVRLLESEHINFAPFPLRVDVSVNRVMEDTDEHMTPIGHRGSGSNEYRKRKGLPYIPENSVQSYNHAYKMGAKWSELDVSITSDDVVVVYHDFKIGDTPVWNMTEKQFKSLVKVPTTLKKVFTETNPKLNLAVEIKYPSVDEIESEKLDSVPDLEHFVSKVLKTAEIANNRKLIFASYEPDVVAYIKKTAPDLNVFLLTEGVPNKFTDPRRNSLEEGIQFCVEHDLQGIVTDTETVTCDPVRYAATLHSAGLYLVLYFYRAFFKETNFIGEIAKFDCAGIDGIVVDDTRLVVKVSSNTTSCFYNYLEDNDQCETVG